MTISATTILSGATLVGAPFVPPYVFDEMARRATDPATQNEARDQYEDARKRNLGRLKYSVRPRRPPATTRLFGPKRTGASGLLPEAKLPHFKVYDAKHETSDRKIFTPQNFVRGKGDALSPDEIVNSAYDRLIESTSFFLEVLGINSIDAKGLVLSAAVHVGWKYANAYYNNGKICFGDGDGVVFKDFAKDLSVLAHELGHGIVDKVLGGLTYWGQSGALNESIADVLGISALQYALGETPNLQATWNVGGKAMVPYTDADGNLIQPNLRSFSAPGTAYVNHPRIGTDPQSPTMDGYYAGSDDNYGVHINSGIPNHAYYLVATQMGAEAWTTILPIWLEAAKSLGQNPNFVDFASRTVQKAEEMFPDRPDIKGIIEKAWDAVKVTGTNAVETPIAYEIPVGPERKQIIKIFKLDAKEIATMEGRVSASGLPHLAGVRRCRVGFVLDKDLTARLVCLAYVDEGFQGNLEDHATGLPVQKLILRR